MPKEISEDDRLKVLAMVTMANQHYRDACKIDMAIQRLLGQPATFYGEGAIGDIIYNADGFSISALDDALKTDDIIVLPNSG